MLLTKPANRLSSQDIQNELLLNLGAVVPFIGVIKQDAVRIRWTSGLRRLFHLSESQKSWRGGPFFNEHVLAEDQAKLRQAITRLLDHGENLDVTYCLNDGTATRCLQVCACLESQGGAQRVVGVFKDCSGDTAVERRRQASQERLQSVGRLTLLGEVASGLAHELNQPLAAIATFAQAGERLLGLPEPRITKAQEVFREVSQQALRAGEIIRHMRSLIKRRAAQFELVTCETLMAEFLALAEPIARATQVQLVTSIEAPDRRVLVDQAQIYQALMILFQNALEATQEHAKNSRVSPQVRVVLRPRDTGVELAIEDQGPGISDAVAAQLFQPFFSTKETGTGLGLISARNMLEAHHCRLSFINLPGGGCRFWFELPYGTALQQHSK